MAARSRACCCRAGAQPRSCPIHPLMPIHGVGAPAHSEIPGTEAVLRHAPPTASRRPVAPPTYAFGRASALSWEGTSDRLGRARAYWLATTNPVGTPHVTPVWGVWLDGYLWFDGLPTTR